jgi:ApaG protein
MDVHRYSLSQILAFLSSNPHLMKEPDPRRRIVYCRPSLGGRLYASKTEYYLNATPMMNAKNAIKIDTHIDYLESESQPDAGRYVFAYTITISNQSEEAARLLTRHWVITDAHGKVQEVQGAGVVGETPKIPPGHAFRYTSAAMIETPVGTMEGAYQMRSESGEMFDAKIPAFTLAVPRTLH